MTCPLNKIIWLWVFFIITPLLVLNSPVSAQTIPPDIQNRIQEAFNKPCTGEILKFFPISNISPLLTKLVQTIQLKTSSESILMCIFAEDSKNLTSNSIWAWRLKLNSDGDTDTAFQKITENSEIASGFPELRLQSISEDSISGAHKDGYMAASKKCSYIFVVSSRRAPSANDAGDVSNLVNYAVNQASCDALTPPAGQKTSETEIEGIFSSTLIIILIIGGGLAVLAVILITLRKNAGTRTRYSVEAKPNQQLLDYVREARQKGMSNEEIKQNLMSNGWAEKDINNVLF